MNITLTVAEMFAAACERTDRDGREPCALVNCKKCGAEGVPASDNVPGLCWLCEEE